MFTCGKLLVNHGLLYMFTCRLLFTYLWYTCGWLHVQLWLKNCELVVICVRFAFVWLYLLVLISLFHLLVIINVLVLFACGHMSGLYVAHHVKPSFHVHVYDFWQVFTARFPWKDASEVFCFDSFLASTCPLHVRNVTKTYTWKVGFIVYLKTEGLIDLALLLCIQK